MQKRKLNSLLHILQLWILRIVVHVREYLMTFSFVSFIVVVNLLYCITNYFRLYYSEHNKVPSMLWMSQHKLFLKKR